MAAGCRLVVQSSHRRSPAWASAWFQRIALPAGDAQPVQADLGSKRLEPEDSWQRPCARRGAFSRYTDQRFEAQAEGAEAFAPRVSTELYARFAKLVRDLRDAGRLDAFGRRPSAGLFGASTPPMLVLGGLDPTAVGSVPAALRGPTRGIPRPKRGLTFGAPAL
jgi:hypothetical protein